MAGEPHIYVISGLPGAGKSATARALARRFDRGAHVEADRLQELIVSGAAEGDIDGIGPEARRQIDLRLEHACLLARSFAAHGFTAVVDDIVIGDAVADVERHLAGVDFIFVMLLPDFAVVRERWIRMGSPFVGAWDWMDVEIRERTTRIGRWIDTTDLDVAATVDAILD